MTPRNKAKLASNLLEAQDLILSIIRSDELSEWSRAGVFGIEEKINNCADILLSSVTQEDFVYATCEHDPKFFIENFVKIRTPHGELPFKLNPLQLEVLNGWINNDKCMTKHPRQSGVSTLNVAYALWCSLFKQNETIVMISTLQQNSRRLSELFKEMYENLPVFLKMKRFNSEMLRVDLENGNRVIFKSDGNHYDGFRGYSITRAFFDDYRFYKRFDELIYTMKPCFTRKPKMYFNSCNNKTFRGTVPACDWVGSFDFTYDKSKDAMWAVRTIQQIGMERFEQEYM